MSQSLRGLYGQFRYYATVQESGIPANNWAERQRDRKKKTALEDPLLGLGCLVCLLSFGVFVSLVFGVFLFFCSVFFF